MRQKNELQAGIIVALVDNPVNMSAQFSIQNRKHDMVKNLWRNYGEVMKGLLGIVHLAANQVLSLPTKVHLVIS